MADRPYHGVSKPQLQVYLDEFVFRHNRRKTPTAAFQTLWKGSILDHLRPN
jgi:hypothetical protein